MCEECDKDRAEVSQPLVFNADRAWQVLAHILANPDLHDQSQWFSQNCQTKGCVAGWATSFAGRTMIRAYPGRIEVDMASVLDSDPFVSDPDTVSPSPHYTPNPEYLAAVAEYNAALVVYKSTKATYETEYLAEVDAWQEDALDPTKVSRSAPEYAPPTRPTPPFATIENHDVTQVDAVPISVAARYDLGISDRMANYLFTGHRTIGEITITLGALISGFPESEVFRRFIENRQPSQEGLQVMVRESRQLYTRTMDLLASMGADINQ